MDHRSLILEAARRLTLEHGVVPSLNSVASKAGVSKGGLMHHFPSRSALMRGLAVAALEELDAAMLSASADSRAGEAWLRLSVPTGDDATLFRALAIAHRTVETPGDDVAAAAQEAAYRWEAMIEKETGDPILARVIRLVGDGLAANVIAGIEPAPSPDELDLIIAALIPDRGKAGL